MAEYRVLGVLDFEHERISRLFDEVSDPGADRVEVLFDITRRLAAHVAVEQGVFLPVVRERQIGGPETAGELEQDYREIHRLLVLIERRKVNSPDIPQLVTELKDVFEAHTGRFSESICGSAMEHLGAQELEELRRRLENADETILSHPHPHMLSLGPISRLTTRIAARIDRMRDQTVRNRYVPSSASDREALRAADPRLRPGPAAKGSQR
jgi:hypothetical protein